MAVLSEEGTQGMAMDSAAAGSPRQQFDQQMAAVQQDVVRMGSVVGQMLQKAMEAYRLREPGLVREVSSLDDIVDKYNLNIEADCLHLLALQNPMARDLRVVAAALKIITDVERVGDYCIDIARTASRAFDEPPLEEAPDLPAMAEIVSRMLHETLEAFVNHDIGLVQEMIQHDDQVDHLYRTTHDDMIALIRRQPALAAQAVAAIMIARYLERIADHITNVGERVYYVETGEHKELHQ